MDDALGSGKRHWLKRSNAAIEESKIQTVQGILWVAQPFTAAMKRPIYIWALAPEVPPVHPCDVQLTLITAVVAWWNAWARTER